MISAQLAAPDVGPQPRQIGPDVLYWGYQTPGQFKKHMLDQCAALADPPCAGTLAKYYDFDGNFSHWGLSLVCSGDGAEDVEECLRENALDIGASPMWP